MLIVGIAQPGPAQQRRQPTAVQQIRERMNSYVRKGTVAGIVTVIAHRGRVVSLHAVGEQEIESHTPMRVNTIFQVRSMTKSVTAAAVMSLVDAGNVNLRDAVTKYIPEFSAIEVLDDPAAEAKPRKPKRGIILYDLLTHTSGLPDEKPRELNSRLPLPSSLAEDAAQVAQVVLEREPGTRYRYSDLGYTVLGRVVEVASGRRFEEYLDAAIFQPLGMHNSFVTLRRDRRARVASTYGVVEGKLQKSDYYDVSKMDWLGYPRPSWSLFSTAGDLVTFYQMVLNEGSYRGVRVLSAAAVRLMTAPHVFFESRTFPGKRSYGLGWWVSEEPSYRYWYQSKGSYGHAGLLGTFAWVDPDRKLIRIFLISRAPGRPEDVLGEELDAFMTMAGATGLE